MGGTQTTASKTELPEGVLNLMNDSAWRIGQTADQNPIWQYNYANPQGVAGFNNWDSAAANRLNTATQRPGTEWGAEWYAMNVPNIVGQTPGSYYSATAYRPEASNQALAWLNPLTEGAGYVPQQFYLNTPYQEQLALAEAQGASARAQQALGGYQGLQQYAQNVPGDYAGWANFARQNSDYYDNLLPTGGTLATSPALAQANQAFLTNILPTIENQAGVAGLGRSTALTNATAQAQAQYMLPLVQEELGREFAANQVRAQADERGIERALGIGQSYLGAQERGLERGVNVGLAGQQAALQVPQTMLAASQQLAALGAQDTARQLATAGALERGNTQRLQAIESAIQTLQSQGQQDLARQLELATAEERSLARYGQAAEGAASQLFNLGAAETARQQFGYQGAQNFADIQRQYEQAQFDSLYNDYLRRQALAEQAVYSPFGATIPTALPQQVRQTGGGMFK